MNEQLSQDEGTITRCFKGVCAGAESDIALLWSLCEPRLRILAHLALEKRGFRGMVDADDVSNSTFEIFVRKIADGHFPWLKDRFGLWPILMKIASHVIANAQRKDRKKDGTGRVIRESDSATVAGYLSHIADPHSDFALTEIEDMLRFVLSQLSPDLSPIAELALQGKSPTEIAETLHILLRSVERKLVLIRESWKKLDA